MFMSFAVGEIRDTKDMFKSWIKTVLYTNHITENNEFIFIKISN